SECPSGVDIAKMKAEFLQNYYDVNGSSFRSKVIANFTKSQQLGALVAPLYNAIVKSPALSSLVKRVVGFAPKRSLPTVSFNTLRRWSKNRKGTAAQRKVYLFCDEFTNYNDTQ